MFLTIEKYRTSFLINAVLASFSCTAIAAHAASPVNFEPAYVADQENISVQMIAAESEQFSYLGQLLASQLDAPQRQRELDAAEVEVRRAELLIKTNSISLEELQAKRAQRDMARNAIEVGNAKTQVALNMAEVAKYKILDDAQRNGDVLKAAANAQVLCSEAQRFLAVKSLDGARSFFAYSTIREATGKELLKSGGMTEQEYAQRLRMVESAQSAIKIAQVQVEAMTSAVAAAKRTLLRVSALTNGPQ